MLDAELHIFASRFSVLVNDVDIGTHLIAANRTRGDQECIFIFPNLNLDANEQAGQQNLPSARLVFEFRPQLKRAGILVDPRIVIVEMPLERKNFVAASLKLYFNFSWVDGIFLSAAGISLKIQQETFTDVEIGPDGIVLDDFN
jgi:hypothetical protein